ncbi:uncharacterized protein MTY_0198 [Moorella thermoacetica Y72]|uniref:Uncharacterized protein n=2 Tax=Neomoorella thermoacetica TaxID=1525 RepID=A0A0S6UBU2_NEOTH|nr:uncharacterized protein MTY_0198 [Moorella thermoacetica Y72]
MVIRLRLRIVLQPGEEGRGRPMVLPLDFRRHFISLIKTLAGTSGLAARFTLEKPGYSPYVFSVEFSKIIDIVTRQREITARPPILVTISTGLFDVMTTFSNGAIAMKGRETVLGLYLKDIYLLPLKKIQTGEQEFRIAGHAVFRGVRHYVDGSDVGELEEAINTHLATKVRAQRGGLIINPVRVKK